MVRGEKCFQNFQDVCHFQNDYQNTALKMGNANALWGSLAYKEGLYPFKEKKKVLRQAHYNALSFLQDMQKVYGLTY
jgi:hypothetical protein